MKYRDFPTGSTLLSSFFDPYVNEQPPFLILVSPLLTSWDFGRTALFIFAAHQ